MTSITQNDVNYRQLFKDLVFGWSPIYLDKLSAHLKHLSVFDQVDIEQVRTSYYNNAKERGLPTEKEALSRLKEEELWRPSDETKIIEQEKFVKSAFFFVKRGNNFL